MFKVARKGLPSFFIRQPGYPAISQLLDHHDVRGPVAQSTSLLAGNGGGGGGRSGCLPGGAAGGAADVRGRPADAEGVCGGDPAPLRGPPWSSPGLRRGSACPRRRPRGGALHHPYDSPGHTRAFRIFRYDSMLLASHPSLASPVRDLGLLIGS